MRKPNTAVVDGHADVRINDDYANDGISDDTLCEILGASCRVAFLLLLLLLGSPSEIHEFSLKQACTAEPLPLSEYGSF